MVSGNLSESEMKKFVNKKNYQFVDLKKSRKNLLKLWWQRGKTIEVA